MIIELQKQYRMITPIGPGYAVIFRDYGIESHDYWTVVDDATGGLWTWPNHVLRMENNITLGRQCKAALHMEKENEENTKRNS